MKTVFISGPMTGYPDFNHETFNQAADLLRWAGFDVINPANLRIVEGKRRWDYLADCLTLMEIANMRRGPENCIIALLPYWWQSGGGAAERGVAEYYGWWRAEFRSIEAKILWEAGYGKELSISDDIALAFFDAETSGADNLAPADAGRG